MSEKSLKEFTKGCLKTKQSVEHICRMKLIHDNGGAMTRKNSLSVKMIFGERLVKLKIENFVLGFLSI